MSNWPGWIAFSLVLAVAPARAADSQIVAGVDTSRWHGFNLLEKFTLRGNAPYQEDDFRWIAGFGFNFVRLPMDYRCYTDPNDWLKFNESALREIDQAIALGARHGVHVCLNLHRAPGFCINPPAESLDLWTDERALAAFVAHWTMFARRYRDIPPDRLSFNLLNEPTRTTRENYLKVHLRAIEAIQREDPRRLIIADGFEVGRTPSPEFLNYPNVIQATRGYHPSTISHFRANWVKGSDHWAEPTWPAPTLIGHLYGPAKPDLKSPLVLRGEFVAGSEISLELVLLSGSATLQAKGDSVVIFEQRFDPKENPADWKPVKSDGKWVYHQPARPFHFTFTVPKFVREISIENVAGDWIQFGWLRFKEAGGIRFASGADASWGRQQVPHTLARNGKLLPPEGTTPAQPLVEYLKPWREIAARGETVFVGEWGCYNKTPHAVALAWMRSWLEQWQDARFGWALWNFRGSFGILDSGRTDVRYEDWHGHKLDREMLALLQAYR